MIISSRTICKNGVSLSIQASAFNYCRPRTCFGPWTHFEVGIVKDASGALIYPKEFEPYKDGEDTNVYAYVPKEVINKFIFDNGGPADQDILIDSKVDRVRKVLDDLIATIISTK